MSNNFRGLVIDIAIPGYRIIRSIGKGGMATVYLAIQESFQREVALKIMSATLSEDSNFSERFLQEARIVSRLIHPNIVTVHDVGIYQGHHYLSMAYVPGYELKEKLSSLGGAEILRVVTDVARALNYSGKKGFVHRDVKPENILLHEEDGHAVLMDFGIARAADVASSMTMTGMALGTPHYMSPEQARGKAVDPRSDLYSLGVLMYLMITGAVPYEAETAVAIGIKHISEPIPTLPAPLASFQPVIDKLMAKKPEDRFQSGDELIEALEALSPDALDEWAQQRAAKPVGRHDTPVRNITKPVAPAAASTARRVPASNTAASAPPAGDALHIPREDIFDRKDRQQKPAGVGLWWGLLLVLVVLVAAAAYRGFSDPESYQQWLVALGIKEAVIEQPVPAIAGAEVQTETGAALPVTAAPLAGPEPLPELVPAPVTPEFSTVLQQLQEVAAELALIVERDASRKPELIALYRDILEIEPDQPEALQSLDDLRQQQLDEAQVAIDSGDMTAARQALMGALVNFPALAEDPLYTELQQQIGNEQKFGEQLDLAEQYLQQDKLMAPAGANAREIYDAVLAEAPTNARAVAGLVAIAARYHQLAMASQRRGDYAQAMGLVKKGLSINEDDLALSALEEELKEQIRLQKSLQQVLAEAAALEKQGIWFAAENSAAQRYLKVLSIQPGQAQAASGLQKLVDELARQVTAQLGLHNPGQASALLAPALALMPANQQLNELAGQIAASEPKVTELELSSVADFSDVQTNGKLKAGRTLYIRFHYRNFNPATTVLQAVLYDGGRTVQIAEIPVIVNGEQGTSSFRIDRSVEGFNEGGYHIDMLLEGKQVATRDFVVAAFE